MDDDPLSAVSTLPAAGLTGGAVLFGFSRSLMIFYVLVCSAQKLHDAMFTAVIRTPVRFFDVNPIGESRPRRFAATRRVNVAAFMFNLWPSATQEGSSTGSPRTSA